MTGMSRALMGAIVDEVFDGAIEDTKVIEDIYAAIKRFEGAAKSPMGMDGWDHEAARVGRAAMERMCALDLIDDTTEDVDFVISQVDRLALSAAPAPGVKDTPPPSTHLLGDLSRSDPSRDSTFVILEKDTREGASDFRPVVALVPVGDQGLQLRGDFEPVDIDLSGLSRRIGLEAGNFDYCLGVRRGEAIGLVRNVHFRSVSSEDADE